MIERMKKIYLLTLESRREDTVNKLKKSGVLHISTKRKEHPSIENLEEKKNTIEKAKNRIAEYEIETGKSISVPDIPKEQIVEAALEKGNEILDLAGNIRDHREELEKLTREKSRLELWGDFDPSEIERLHEKGVSIKLYTASPETFDNMPHTVTIFPIQTTKNQIRFAAVSLSDKEFPELQEENLGNKSLSEINKEIEKKQSSISELDSLLAERKKEEPLLEKGIAILDDLIEYNQVKEGMNQEGALAYLIGFVPESRLDKIRSDAAAHGWAILIENPGPDDPVPTKIKNKPFVRIIQPVFDLLGTVPGYREYDISFVFLMFFTVFFAMIIGDGGYGAVLLMGSIYFSVKSRKTTGKVSDGLILLNLLSFATIVWGAITGTWFGYALIAETPPFSWFVIPGMSSFDPQSAELIQFICFVIGTIHLVISHLWNFMDQLKKHPRIKAFAQLGWLSMLLGLYYLVLNLVLSPEQYPLPQFATWLIFGGLAMIIIFSEQEGNFLKGIFRGLAGIITTLLDGIGAFSDIISYIRLFAVGLASVEIAKSFNSMAADFGGSIGGIAAGILVLFLGHSLNLAMGALSVIVHGVRLNMLEFSGHLGMEWTGIPYEPFKENVTEEDNSSLNRKKVETA